MSEPFRGFSGDTFAFLRGLAGNNSRDWFEAHRDDYESFYVEPARRFVAALGPELQKIDKHVKYEAKINGSIFRINRDVRFSKDKTPYKAHLDLWFWQGERRGWDSPGFFLRLAPDTLIVGGGMHQLGKEQLATFRAAVIADRTGKALEQVLAQVGKGGKYTIGGATRKTVPRGFDHDHPRASLLLHEGLYVGWEGPPPASVKSARFVATCAEHCRVAAPVAKWLRDHVTGG